MSRQFIFIFSSFLTLLLLLSGHEAFSQTWDIYDTQERRASERFDIISWIRGNQSIVSRQNAKYGYGGSKHGPPLDVVLSVHQDTGSVVRTSTTLGNDTRASGKAVVLLDDLFTRGNSKSSLNIDLGGEFFASQTTSFAVATGVTQSGHAYNETGGGLVIRPFGRSSQDTGLLVKGGYVNITESGLWGNSSTQALLFAPYLGAEAKLYLLPLLGIYGDYQATLSTQANNLQGQWQLQRFMYGGFLEIFLVQISAYFVNTQMTLTPSSTNSAINENYSGFGLGGSLFF